MRARLKKILSVFSRAQGGVAAVEFALVLPALLAILIGGFEISRFIIVNQKLDHVAYTTADVVAQETSVTQAQLADVMNAAAKIMDPFAFGPNGVVIVSSVYQDPTDGPVVLWQSSGGGTLERASHVGEVGDPAVLPDGFNLNDTDNVIVAEVFYSYTPVLTEEYFATRENYKFAVFKPRFGALTTTPN